ncbi:MAG: methylenetetrahydrofolate reductase [NAD(P)H] [Actinomycetota bacterium]|nr:methylenetetrahydrofolate reductase [NAD(P)H] [Actinomycetota bacterium]PLS76753.1 MAG: methylenetetrahydrofolate reductase [NAD(P)H] [Actinomycetota bacterium]
MARIADLLAVGPTFSFEFFPPRTEEAERALEQALAELEPLRPSFVSVTYGAGGSTRERTHDIVARINRDTSMTAMAHLTCAGHTRAELTEIITGYRAEGLENILALAGDPPSTTTGEQPPPADFRYATELVELVRSLGHFCVGVAAHPELHPRSAGDRAADRDRLAAKLAAADFAITQFFFTTEPYLRMVEELADRDVTAPVIPGVMPVTNVSQVERFAQLSGSAFPAELAERLHAVADRPDDVRRIGVEVATKLCQDLLDAGVPGLHFYTLNRSTATREIYANLGLGADGAGLSARNHA